MSKHDLFDPPPICKIFNIHHRKKLNKNDVEFDLVWVLFL